MSTVDTSATAPRRQQQTATSFEVLGVQQWLAKQCAYLALTRPTPIQTACIPAVLSGKHVIGGAATGSGKTAAFALPILQMLSEEMYGVFALVVTPARELAYQILDQFIAFGAAAGVRAVLAIGGVRHDKQFEAIQGRPHVVVATPGRLQFLFNTFPELLKAFANLKFLVLDEADRLTEGDIAADTNNVVETLAALKKPGRQTLLFTATVSTALTRLGEGSLLESLGVEKASDCVAVHVATDSTVREIALTQAATGDTSESGEKEGTDDALDLVTLPPTLAQEYLFVPDMVKLQYLVVLLRSRGPEQTTIVFTNSALRCELVRLALQLLGFPVSSLDSLLTQQHRLNNLALFKLRLARILVATDIASRGLDIPDVSMVVHYDVPKLPATYLHRVGRTARAGRDGLSVALVTEFDVRLVHRIERTIQGKLAEHSAKGVDEEAVMAVLDEVSGAKVQAKLQVTKQFETRVATLKEHAEQKREERAERHQQFRQQQKRRRDQEHATPTRDEASERASTRKEGKGITKRKVEGGPTKSSNSNNALPSKKTASKQKVDSTTTTTTTTTIKSTKVPKKGTKQVANKTKKKQ